MSAEVEFVTMSTSSRSRGRHAPLSQPVVAGMVVLCDIIAGALPPFVIYLVYLGSESARGIECSAVTALSVLLIVLGLHAAGLYRFPAILHPARHVRRLLGVSLFVFLVLVALAFSLKVSSDFSRIWAFASMLLATVMILALRFSIASTLTRFAKQGRVARTIVVYGAEVHGQRLIERIEALSEPWNKIVGVFDDRTSRVAPVVHGYPVLGNLAELIAWGRRHRPDEVLVALPWSAESRLSQVLEALAVLPANVRLCSEFMRPDLIGGRVNSQFGIPMLNAFEKPMAGWGRIWKRGFDTLLSALIILLAMPMFVVIAVLIRLESPGPILFRQPRYGFNNQLIEVFKFRTMEASAADALGVRLTERDDPRVTRVGTYLRRFSLDELPQLLNVLCGEMSLVGPRPHAIRTTAGTRQCDEVVAAYAVRHKVKPGITGWAQVSGWRGTMETEDHLIQRVEHDLYYVKNWSAWLDLKILFMTFWTVVAGRNSF